ncbi:MAG: flippase activity-associated protein Agl23 [Halobacteriaceae archaeon]
MRRIRTRPAIVGVLAATALGLFLRLWALGARTVHPEEARLGVSVLNVMEAGRYVYTPVFHGPLLYHLNSALFTLLGASEATMRLGVALVGACLPLTAWLFRKRLSDAAVVALAALFAVTPVAVYYSRFMANDVALATFGVATVGFAVRLADTGRRRYLYAGAVSLALAAATKWYVLVYVGCWLGAAALLVDYRLFTAAAGEGDAEATAGDLLATAREEVDRWSAPLFLAVVLFLASCVLLFAPRPEIYNAVTSPGLIPEVVERGTWTAWDRLYAEYVRNRPTTYHPFTDYFTAYVKDIVAGAAVPVGLGAVGFVLDRYTGGGQRDVVAFATYWGAAGLLLYPALAPDPGAWNAVHTAVPLAIPAAVTLAAVYDKGRRALATDRRELAAVAGIALLLVGGHVAAGAYTATFGPPNSGALAGPDQPADDLQAALQPVADVAPSNEGVDVALFGSAIRTDGGNRPLNWYLRLADAQSETYRTKFDLPDDLPPVVIAANVSEGDEPTDAARVARALEGEGYERRGPYAARGDGSLPLVVFVAVNR